MDIYEYLKKDHRKVSELFKQFEKTKDTLYKTEIVALLAKELILHSESEENTLYKYLEHHDQTESIVKHSETEHSDITKQLAEVVKTQKTDGNWERKVKKLKELVDHHVKEEEGKLFRRAKKVLSKEEALRMKEKMHDYKEKLLNGVKT